MAKGLCGEPVGGKGGVQRLSLGAARNPGDLKDTKRTSLLCVTIATESYEFPSTKAPSAKESRTEHACSRAGGGVYMEMRQW